MRCEDAIEQLSQRGLPSRGSVSAAFEHASSCDDCRAALRAMDALHALRRESTPTPREGAIERAIERALAVAPKERYRRGFWQGVVSGAALAATLAAVVFGGWLVVVDEGAVAVPEVRLTPNEPRDVTVTLETSERLAAAAVRVELRGAVALAGYGGQRELRWSADLEPGVNQLTLPVVALDAAGGQVLVEVAHGDKRRTFVLDVRTTAAG